MLDLFGGRETIDILDQFLLATADDVDDLIELAGATRVEVEFLAVHIRRRPIGFRDGIQVREGREVRVRR